MKIDEGAEQGDNTFDVIIKDSATGVDVVEELTLSISSRDATISIESVDIDPEEISPGGQGTITVTVKNNAPTSFTDLNFKLYLQASQGSTFIDFPFAPVGSSAEKRLYRLSAGESGQFTFDIKAYPDAASMLYKIPFVLEYYDSLGNKKNKTDFIGLTVNSVPDIAVLLDQTDITEKNKAGTVSLKVINKGLSDIKFLNVILEDGETYDVLSGSSANYIGNLESDDFQTVDYLIAVNPDAQEASLPVKLQYRDANNKLYEETYNVPLRMIDSSRLQNTSFPFGTVIIVLIVIAAIVWFFVKRARKGKKGQF